jgi:glycosyltransferase involved in cell wall biosynthesis
MRVLMLGTRAPGGMDYVAKSYLNSDLGKTYRIKFIPTHIETNPIFKMLYFGLSLFRTLPYLFNKNYKIFHMHLSSRASVYRKRIFINLGRLFGKKLILHAHDPGFFIFLEQKSEFMKKLVKTTLRRADCFVVLSNVRKDEYSRIVDRDKIHVIYNFVDDPHYQRLDKEKGVPQAISLGRLGERKATGLLIQAIHNLKVKPVQLSLYGDGDLETYRNSVRALRLDDKIKVPGWISGLEKTKALESADLFILPSLHEDMPIAIIEAMSYGLPIISTKTGGIPEMVIDGTNGFLLEPGNLSQLSEAIERLIADATLRQKMGFNSYLLFKKNFETGVVTKQIASLYEELGAR